MIEGKVNKLNLDFVLYAFRCVVGFTIGYYLYIRFPQYELFWTLLSIILVISPEAKDSKKLSLDRSIANLIGSSVGLFCFYIEIPDLYRVIIGIILSIAICHTFKLISVARTAIVALIIILIEHKNDANLAPIVRFISVAAGCLIGLLVTVITSYIIDFFTKKRKAK